jgi:hypothetical protein
VKRPVGAMLEETDEEWQYGERRHMSAVSLQKLLPQQLPDTPTKEPTHA